MPVVISLIFVLLFISACNSSDQPSAPLEEEVVLDLSDPQSPDQQSDDNYNTKQQPGPVPTKTITPSPEPTASPTPMPSPSPSPTTEPRRFLVDAMIFNGVGVNASNGQALIDLVASHGLSYEVIDSAKLNSMPLDQLLKYGVFVWPGGDANQMNSALTSETRVRVRQAVRQGVGYAGFCAGAWIAVGPDALNKAPYWGFAIASGDYLKVFYPLVPPPPDGFMVWVQFPDGSKRNVVWWQGPFLWKSLGSIIAKYADGSSAISETWSGLGYVTLSGVHTEAPQSWRDGIGLVDSDGLDLDIAWDMIDAALKQRPLAAF